jgi:hypothetical protein
MANIVQENISLLQFLWHIKEKYINLEGNTHTQEINVSQCPV